MTTKEITWLCCLAFVVTYWLIIKPIYDFVIKPKLLKNKKINRS